MSNTTSDSNVSLGYYPSMYTVVRDNMTRTKEWANADLLYLVEEFMQQLPGFGEVDLRNQCACGTVELDLLEAIPDAMDKPLKVIFRELDAMAIGAVKKANAWLDQVYSHLPELNKRLAKLEELRSFDYDYPRFDSLVQKEAFMVLEDTPVMDIRGRHEALPHAVALLVAYWEETSEKRDSYYDHLN